MKQLVVDKDKTIKKLQESNTKEVNRLMIEKKASDDALSCATRENTRIKDKEGTLVDVFKCMKTVFWF